MQTPVVEAQGDKEVSVIRWAFGAHLALCYLIHKLRYVELLGVAECRVEGLYVAEVAEAEYAYGVLLHRATHNKPVALELLDEVGLESILDSYYVALVGTSERKPYAARLLHRT